MTAGTERLAEYVQRMLSGNMPKPAERAARICLLDTLGAGLYGGTVSEAKSVIAAVRQMGGSGEACIWGTGHRASADLAAFVCGTMCHVRELDDVHFTILHTGAVCVPAAVAVSHRSGGNLGELLKSVAAGVEVSVRIAKGMDYLDHRRRGWHGTATCGAFGAAAAAGVLLKLTGAQMADALGLSGSRTGGTWAFAADGSVSKRLHPGLAAKDGVLCAYLAQQGLRGPRYVLESDDGGFYPVTSGKWSIQGLDEPSEVWAVEEVEYKWYSSCKSVHSPLSAAQQICVRNKDRRPEDITSVHVGVNASALSMAGGMYDRDSVISAQLSIPCGVALGLLGHSGQIRDYEPEILKSQALYTLASKVEVSENLEMEELRRDAHKSGGVLTVNWADGYSDSETQADPKGSQGNRLTQYDAAEKYMELASGVLGECRARELMELVLYGSLDTPSAELTALLV